MFSNAEILKEIARRNAKRSLLAFTKFTFSQYEIAPHHTRIAEALEAVERGETDRLIITIPPRHGKSELASVRFPPWYLGRNPTNRIISATYSADLSKDFGKKARNVVSSDEFEDVFGISISKSSASKNEWDLENEIGGYYGTGVGGAATGKGAHVLLIDDPIKNRAEANSETVRQSIWDWYTSTAYTRLEKNGAIVIIMCMTGDTPVLMSDGRETPLRDIKIGDEIATYDKGKLSISTVRNHINNGADFVYKIKTTSGKIVKANERHPFLVDDNGELKWIRLRNLNTTHKIVTLRENGESGKEKRVLKMDAISQQKQKGIATHTTTKRNGRMGIDHHQLMQNQEEMQGLNTDTELHHQNMMQCMKSKMEDVQFVSKHHLEMSEHIGEINYVSTIATKQEQSGHYYVTTVTLQSDMQNQNKQHYQLQNISDFTTDQIVSIEFNGVEDVFDIQVDRTENFIANGLVSHNTRWHDDDLVGRLLEEQRKGGEYAENWTVVHMPALDEDNNALWENKYNSNALLRIKKNIGSFDFEALYQGRPTPLGGGIIKTEWWRYYSEAPPYYDLVIQTLDTAQKTKELNDYSVIATWVRHENKIYLINITRGKWEMPDLERMAISEYNKFRPSKVLIEDKSSGTALIQSLRRNQSIPITAVQVSTDKVTRVQEVVGFIESGYCHLPHFSDFLSDFLTEHAAFPNAKHDDQVDTTTMAIKELMGFNQGNTAIIDYYKAMAGK